MLVPLILLVKSVMQDDKATMPDHKTQKRLCEIIVAANICLSFHVIIIKWTIPLYAGISRIHLKATIPHPAVVKKLVFSTSFETFFVHFMKICV